VRRNVKFGWKDDQRDYCALNLKGVLVTEMLNVFRAATMRFLEARRQHANKHIINSLFFDCVQRFHNTTPEPFTT
jgi:hypothetical protein